MIHSYKGFDVRVEETIGGKFVGYIDGTTIVVFCDCVLDAIAHAVATIMFKHGARSQRMIDFDKTMARIREKRNG